jgi:short-subunit dehydrogenase
VDLTGRTALVTGATGGLGQAIARALHARGASLMLTGRRPDALAALAEETGGTALEADLSSPDDLARLVTEAGQVDVLVANAGIPADGPVLEYTLEQIDRAIDVNLRAPLHLARALADPMVARGQGHIVFVSSVAGKAASTHSGVYSATKFGLRGFASGLRQDLHGTGVGVSCVLPGFIRDAGMFADAGAKAPPGSATKRPGDVAGAVVRAIERDVGEIVVGSPGERFWAFLGGVSPATLGWIGHRFGGREFAAALSESEAHRSKR